jgi:hypothetical protein
MASMRRKRPFVPVLSVLHSCSFVVENKERSQLSLKLGDETVDHGINAELEFLSIGDWTRGFSVENLRVGLLSHSFEELLSRRIEILCCERFAESCSILYSYPEMPSAGCGETDEQCAPFKKLHFVRQYLNELLLRLALDSRLELFVHAPKDLVSAETLIIFQFVVEVLGPGRLGGQQRIEIVKMQRRRSGDGGGQSIKRRLIGGKSFSLLSKPSDFHAHLVALSDGGENLKPVNHFPKDAVQIIQPIGLAQGNEKLRSVRIRTVVGHRKYSQSIVPQPGNELVGEFLPWSALAVAQGIATPHDESRDHAVKSQPIEKRFSGYWTERPFCEPDKIRHG